MKKKVGRVEAKLIMMAAKEFRERERLAATNTVELEVVELPEQPTVAEIPQVVEPIPAPKVTLVRYVIDFFRKKGT